MTEAQPFPAAELFAAVAGRVGLMQMAIPGFAHDLWFRAGTKDAGTCENFIAWLPGGLKIPYEPRRILEIGAGAGYRSLALARAFPDAEILATEADPTYRAVNLLNTLPCQNITSVFTAVGTAPGQFAYLARAGGDGHLALAPFPAGPVAATPLPDLLARPGWDAYDTVIITPDAASKTLLQAGWPASVRLIAVFTGGGELPGDIAQHYPDEQFLTRQEGRYVLLFRREVQVKLPAVPPVPIFAPGGPPREMALVNVSAEPWGYFPIGNGFRLHPNRGGGPAARLVLAQECRGFGKVNCTVRVGHPAAQPVQFTIAITAEPEGNEIFRATQTAGGGAEAVLAGDLPPYFGACRITFSTKMAAAGAPNSAAWAEFIDPVFL
jgi:hypothetical protein